MTQTVQTSGWRWVGLAVICVSVGLLRGDPMGTQQPVRVVYVGSGLEGADAPFQGFVKALDALAPERRQRLSLRYVQALETDDATLTQGLATALALHPDVLVAPTGNTARIAARLAAPSPLATAAPKLAAMAVVFASYPDPLQLGLVQSLHRPGGRFTGVSLVDDLDVKRLELLRDAFPATRQVAVLADRDWAEARQAERDLPAAAAALGLSLRFMYADTLPELDRLMRGAEAVGVQAWYIPPSYIAYVAEAQIIAHLARLQRPAIHATQGEVQQGALMAYSQDTTFAFGAMAELTARVAAGEDPAAIPVERPRRFVLSVRPRSAPEALRMDAAVVRRADRVY